MRDCLCSTHTLRMPTFQSKRFLPSSASSGFAGWYRSSLQRHPFALFGLPFITIMVAGSFFLTPATAIRYEKHDRKVQQVSKEEAMGLGKDRKKLDMREEYYRLAAKDLDNWEQRRVKRLPGEIDGILE